MGEDLATSNSVERAAHRRGPRRVRLPGFIIDEEIGLGDVIGHATSAIGIKPCGPCSRRAARANQWLQFSNRQK